MSSFIGDIPDAFICPITHELMEYPFSTKAGHSYEYFAIARWLQQSNQDPLSKVLLTDKALIPNYTLRSSIQSWLAANPDAGEVRNKTVEKPPKEAYAASNNGKAVAETALDRVLRFKRSFTLGEERATENLRVLQTQRLAPTTFNGRTYTWDNKGKSIRCDHGPWVAAPGPDLFITPQGIVFYDCSDLQDSRVLPGTDLADLCKFGGSCTKADCIYAHPFVCRWGLSCRNIRSNSCKFFHPSEDSVVPVGKTFPLKQKCHFNASCSNKTCMYAHPEGRMTVQRQPARLFITHSLTLEELRDPIELPITWPEASTTFQFQGEFVFCFEPYRGTWAKEHFRSVSVQRFDVTKCRYRNVATYSLVNHYCNCAVAAGRYLVISFWPYEEEAIRTVWECLRMGRTMEKALKSSEQEIESLRSEVSSLKAQLHEKENELNYVKAELLSTKGEVTNLRNRLEQLQRSVDYSRQALFVKNQTISTLIAESKQKGGEHARQVQELQSSLFKARSDAKKQERDSQRQYREMQQRYESQRNERLRLRDPIHIYALRDGSSGFAPSDWVQVLDYHKGAHDLNISKPSADGTQVLEILEHSTVLQFQLCVPRNIADIGSPLPLQPGCLCEQF